MIALPPLEDLEKLFVMLRDRLFCRQHSNAGTLQRAGLALFKGKVQSTISFILSSLLFLVSHVPCSVMKRARFSLFFFIAFLVKN